MGRVFYFHISNGLRGCYMPDSSSIVRVTSRRELKNILDYEARDMREAHGYGGSKRAVAAIAAQAWRARGKFTLNHCIPFGREPGNYPFGVFVSAATREDYKSQSDDC